MGKVLPTFDNERGSSSFVIIRRISVVSSWSGIGLAQKQVANFVARFFIKLGRFPATSFSLSPASSWGKVRFRRV